MGPIEEKVLPSPMEFPAQSIIASHPNGVDGYSEDSVSEAPIYVQSTSTHDHAITSPAEPLNWLRLILMAKGQPQKMVVANQSQLVNANRITRNQLGFPPLVTPSIPKVILSKGAGGNTNGIL